MKNIDVNSLKELPIEKLNEIADAAQKAVKLKKEQELLDAWLNFTKKANEADITIENALRQCYKKDFQATSTLPIKYRDPLNPKNKWSGRGRLPIWLRDYRDEGKNIDDYLVKKEG